MVEQEATELIATKLMGWCKEPFSCDWIIKDKKSCENNTSFLYEEPCAGLTVDESIFNPFHDSNHARMVKDKISSNGLGAKYIEALRHRVWPVNRPTMHLMLLEDFFDLHNAPDADCMWSVVDILKEIEK